METETISASNKLQLPGFIELAKETFQIYKAKWKTLLMLFLISYGIVILIAATGVMITLLSILIAKLSASATVFWTMFTILLVAAISLCVLAMSWIMSAIIITINSRQASFGVKESLSRAKSKIIPYLWTGLLAGLIVGAGFMFFILPGIILMVLIFAAGYVAVLEDEKGIGAIAKSREYARGYFGKIILLMALGFIAIILFDAIIKPFEKTLVYPLVQFLTAPLSLIFPYLIFEKLKQIKGEAQIIPTATQKNIFKFIAISGALMITVIIYLLITLIPLLKEAYQSELIQERYRSETGRELPPWPSIDNLMKKNPNIQPPI